MRKTNREKKEIRKKEVTQRAKSKMVSVSDTFANPAKRDFEADARNVPLADADGTVDVHDQTGANKVNLQRSIYLTIMSALDFEEATHKLLKIDLGPGQEVSSL